MRRAPTALVAALLLASLVAPPLHAAPPPPGTPGPAVAPAVPELCRHGVVATICPKCNPKLAAVFRTKGDWCEEHGFQESICPVCHPERGGRPAREVSRDDAPPTGLKVRFKDPATAGRAGIETVAARPSAGGVALAAPAVLAYDATRRGVVNARADGVVEAVLVDVGAHVARGAVLARVESGEAAEVGARRATAVARVEVAEKGVARARELGAKGIVPARELHDAERELASARAELAAATSAGEVMGATGEVTGRYAVVAPLAGTVTAAATTAGQLVTRGDVLFEVVDTSSLWAEIDVPERDLATVRPGTAVELEIAGVPAIASRVDYVAPIVDTATRTARARARVPNPDGRLLANMLARAVVAAPSSPGGVEVPAAALQPARGVELVFVRTGEGEYEARRVTTGVRRDGWVEVTAGVKPGEDVATSGSFLLMTETLRDAIGAGCCEVE